MRRTAEAIAASVVLAAVLPAGCAESTETGTDVPDAAAEHGADADAGPDADADPGAEAEAEADAGVEVEAEVGAEAEADPGREADADLGEEGAADAEARTDTGPASGENCDDPIVVTPVGGTASVSGTTDGLAHDYPGPPACSIGRGWPDVVYEVAVPAGMTIDAAYTSSGIVHCISIQQACPDTSLVGGCTCGDPDTTLEASRTYEEAGTAYIFIWTDAPVAFDLVVDLR
jgi:hypothetical protein